MAFNETFSDLRKRRRIPMRLFEEEAKVSRSYIHGIEQGKLLPSPEKLEKLAAVFVAVAEEQDAADPQGDAQKLFYERERTAVTDRLGFDPKLADPLVSIRNLTSRQRADLSQPLSEALRLFRMIGAKERSSLGPYIKAFVDYYEDLDSEQQSALVLELFAAIEEVMKKAEEEKGKAGKQPPKAERSHRAKSPKRVTSG
jgi:transcriptional regulator with XRE-family HTH domain